MSQTPTKRPFLSSRVKVALGIGVIAILVVLAFFAPPEGETNNATGDLPYTPTVSITNLIATVSVNRQLDFQGMHLTIIKVMQATRFSDDRKSRGAYVVRVMVQARNTSTNPVGVTYDTLVRLVLPNGQEIAPKYISVKPVTLPKAAQSGYFDFPTSTEVDLTSLHMRFGDEAIIALGRQG